MLTFYHSPQSRSTTIALALAEMGINDRVETQTVTVPRVDGTGAVDPKNPHPEGKVPALVHDGHLIWERALLFLHLHLQPLQKLKMLTLMLRQKQLLNALLLKLYYLTFESPWSYPCYDSINLFKPIKGTSTL